MDPINPEGFENHQLSISSLPRMEEVEYMALSRKQLVKSHISTSISLLVFSAIVGTVYHFFGELYNGYFPLVVAMLLLVFLWSYISNWQWQKRSGYALRERDILFKRGFLFEKITVIPFNRIQHASTHRGMLDKLLGLSSLQVFTAGGSGSDINIPGLTPELAASLKEALSARITHHV